LGAPDREIADERRTARAFKLLVVAAVAFGAGTALLLVAVGGLEAARPAIPGALLAALVALLARRIDEGRGVRILLGCALSSCAVAFYPATGAVIRELELPLRDAALRSVDAATLGWLFPDGQIAVWIDRSDLIGPLTLAGRVLTELLQIAYATYFVWGPGLVLLLCWRIWTSAPEGPWMSLRMFLCAWLGSIIINDIMYMLVPAMGPWFFYPEDYLNPLVGIALTVPIRDLLGANQATADCFPSGHTAASWIVAISALRFAPRYGRWALVAAVLITLAAVLLRYHYVVDLLAAPLLVLAGLYGGGFLSRRPPRTEA